MSARDEFSADLRLVGSSKITINSATTTNFSFGSPTDLYLPNIANYHAGNRILVIFRATTAGTTNTVSFSVQDAPDSSGSIGTPAAATTDGTLTGGTGDQTAVTAVLLQWCCCSTAARGCAVGSPARQHGHLRGVRACLRGPGGALIVARSASKSPRPASLVPTGSQGRVGA